MFRGRMVEQKPQFYEFGGFRIDRDERLLKRGAQIVSLPPKAIELLFVLLESGGRMLSKDELMSTVWADSYVEESNLSQNIFLLRKVLGDGKNGNGKYIETIPRRGYRFVADVTEGNGDVFVSREQTLTRILVQEEFEIDDGPRATIAAERSPADSLQLAERSDPGRTWGAFLLTGTLLILVAGASWYFLFSGNRGRSSLPPMRVIPVTSYPDSEYDPSFSPDGGLIAFSWSGGEMNAAPTAYNIYVKQPDVGETLQLTHKEGRSGSPAFSPDGRFIAFAYHPASGSKSQLILIPALGGAERKLYEAVDIFAPRWSPDGKLIVFGARPDRQAPRRLHTISIDTLEVKELTAPVSGEGDAYSAFSPDASRLAFVRVEDAASEIYIRDMAGGEPRRLTYDNRTVHGIAWTNDGTELVFASNRGGNGFMLWRLPVEGGEPVVIAGIGDGAYLPSISRSGRRMTFQRFQSDSNIWRVTADGGTAMKIIASTQREDASSLSQDGHSLAFSSTRSGTREIWVADVDGSNPRQVTSFGGSWVSNPAWSPDGMSIALNSSRDGRSVIYVVAVASGAIRPLTDGNSNSVAPSWSADGSSIYFGSDRGGDWQIWKAPGAGGEPQQITRSGGYEARESADGKFLYYNKAGYGTVGLFRSARDGGDEIKILDLPQLLSIGSWTLTERGVYFIDLSKEQLASGSPPSIRFFDFAIGKTSQVAALAKDPVTDPGLSISPDGKWLIYSSSDTSSSDIMLVENFR